MYRKVKHFLHIALVLCTCSMLSHKIENKKPTTLIPETNKIGRYTKYITTHSIIYKIQY